MLRFIIFAIVAAQLCAASTIIRGLQIDGDLLQGNIELGREEHSDLFAASSLEQVLDQYMNHAQEEQTITRLFDQFKQYYSKHYASDEHENVARGLFAKRMTMVLENNLKALHRKSSYVLTLHSRSDLTLDEILAQPAGVWPQLPNQSQESIVVNESNYVDSWTFDYRDKHQVTSVVNQGGCGSCVYFSAAACVESFWARKGHGLLHLSTQQLVDCAKGNGNDGCKAGTFVPTFDYIQKHGLASWDHYPYVAHDQACDHGKERQPVAHIASWHHITPHGDEMALEAAVRNHGPAAVAIHVSDQLAHYKNGIFEGDCRGGRNHGVLLTGFGWDNQQQKDFWILKNQWGQNWGDHGYFRLRRKHGNMCDVAGDAVYVQ